MPFEIMDQSSFTSKENPLPTERQVGFWKPEAAGKKEMPLFSRKRTTTPSMTSRRADDHVFGFQSDLCMQPSSEFMERNKVVLNGNYYENSLFSSSLSQIFDQKLKLSAKDVPHVQSVDKLNPTIVEDEYFGSLEEIEARTIGNLLPNDDELLSGVIDDLAYVTRSGCGDDLDDLFCSGGGIELEGEDSYNYYKTVDLVGSGASNCHHRDLNNPFGGEHTYGEHPSRTLFVRNISKNIEDSEIRNLFEQYGDIRGLYTTCKHRGFVMISYYDIRAARNAMRALQNQPLGHRKLDIHFSIPKDNPPEKDINQGTLVVFNLESSLSNDDIHQIFGVYGEIKEIRETPHKRHHKFVEFYDVRAAEAALRALNKSDVAGRKIKLEPSRPGGSRRCIIQQLLPHLEREESNRCMRETLPNNLPSRYGSIHVGTIISDVHDNGTINGRHSSFQTPIELFMETPLNRISSNQTQRSSPPSRVNSVGNHINFSNNCELNHSLGQMKLGFQCPPNFNRHSLPEYHDGLAHGIHYGPNVIASMDTKSRPTEGKV